MRVQVALDGRQYSLMQIILIVLLPAVYCWTPLAPQKLLETPPDFGSILVAHIILNTIEMSLQDMVQPVSATNA
jgi:hypothetical protein